MDTRRKCQAQELSVEVKQFCSAKGIHSPTFWKVSYKHQMIRYSPNLAFRNLSFFSLLFCLADPELCYKIISRIVFCEVLVN
ncbi:hypothetical protein L873DRAFT_270708 [Choiromyces venosus 120613-1]|uniref:Uncharacterized protein n=1 Tax=Choiromyces venosus 120613-1 TaxID=1336337 RepID=A0A3N4J538_9PEZI|nr:hypothetical protein L873DRAFT_270708 [Choiromyces venosus 120613-1]